jgi:transposase-like protein
MRHSTKGRQAISAARRGQIVQRVIVDGWTNARAAAAFDLPQRLVEVWVADYRRRGMASLRHAPRRSVAAEIIALRLLRPVAALLHRTRQSWRRLVVHRRQAEPAPLRGRSDDRRDGSA